MTTNKEQGFKPSLYRVIDANLNRLREGIRVIEDINRYYKNDETICRTLKTLRHSCKVSNYKTILASRDAQDDVLRPTQDVELEREALEDVLIANYKRAQESARSLEEVYKIEEPVLSEHFKQVRYNLYTLEKENLLNF